MVFFIVKLGDKKSFTFLAAIAALYVVMSVCPSVGRSVGEQRVSRSLNLYQKGVTNVIKLIKVY